MTTIGGLPAHILLVHAVVGLVPVTALLVVLVAVWPAARRRLTWAAAALAVVTLIVVPVTTEAGEWLEHRVERTALLRGHTELGDRMLPCRLGWGGSPPPSWPGSCSLTARCGAGARWRPPEVRVRLGPRQQARS